MYAQAAFLTLLSLGIMDIASLYHLELTHRRRSAKGITAALAMQAILAAAAICLTGGGRLPAAATVEPRAAAAALMKTRLVIAPGLPPLDPGALFLLAHLFLLVALLPLPRAPSVVALELLLLPLPPSLQLLLGTIPLLHLPPPPPPPPPPPLTRGGYALRPRPRPAPAAP